MSMFNALVSCTSAGVPSLPSPYRALALKASSSPSFIGVSVLRQRSSLHANRRFRLADLNRGTRTIVHAKIGSNFPPQLPNLPKPNLPVWAKCIVGVILSLIEPFWKINGMKLLAFERQVEKVVETVEDVAEVVDDVAEAIEKATKDAAEKLPENSFLKNAVKFVSEISKEVGDDAEDTIDFINKIEEVKDEMERMVEDVIHGEWETKEGEMIMEASKDKKMLEVEIGDEKVKEAAKDKKTLELDIDDGKVKDAVHETLSEEKINNNNRDVEWIKLSKLVHVKDLL